MENKEIQVAPSKNSLTPQIKLRSYLVDVVENEREYRFVEAITKPKIGELEKSKVIPNLIDILAKWRWMSGVATNNQDEDEIAHELALIAKFIDSNYPKVSLEEINLAIDLSLINSLDVEVRTFNVFSPMYVSRILNAYIDHKNAEYNKLMVKKERLLEKERKERKPTPQENMEGIVGLITYLYEKYKEDGSIDDYFSTLYEYFRRIKFLKPDKQMINDAMEYGNKMSDMYIANHYDNFFSRQKVDKDKIQKRFARNFCVQNLFENNSLNDLISVVKITHFE
jgi:hypothetical protein